MPYGGKRVRVNKLYRGGGGGFGWGLGFGGAAGIWFLLSSISYFKCGPATDSITATDKRMTATPNVGAPGQ
jgi:hypothetical protein